MNRELRKEVEPIAILSGSEFVYKSTKFNVSKECILNAVENSKSNPVTIGHHKIYLVELGTNFDNEKIILITQMRAYIPDFRYKLQQLNHDFREPLRNISNFLDLIESSVHSEGNASVTEYINFATDAVKILNNFSKDVLENTAINMQHIKIEKIINDIMVLDKLQIENHNVRILLDDIPEVKGSYSDLMSLFKNLIENAIKHSNIFDILIKIKLQRISSDTVVIKFSNNTTLNNSDIRKIENTLKNKNSGDIHGLKICKSIMDNLHGKLELNKSSKKLSYILTLPLCGT